LQKCLSLALRIRLTGWNWGRRNKADIKVRHGFTRMMRFVPQRILSRCEMIVRIGNFSSQPY
jgi:hypothetical protein